MQEPPTQLVPSNSSLPTASYGVARVVPGLVAAGPLFLVYVGCSNLRAPKLQQRACVAAVAAVAAAAGSFSNVTLTLPAAMLPWCLMQKSSRSWLKFSVNFN
jgi:hypothetical protein